MNNELSKYILTTLTYYDVMDYPMTGFEIWKYLTRISEQEPVSNNIFSLTDVMKELKEDKLKKFIEEYRGYYFLKGRKELVEQRIERNKIAEQKFRIVKKVAWWLRFAPFVRGVAVAGRLAMKNTEAKSDLDLLIFIQQGKIFTGRLLATFLVHILGKRRHSNKINNRICLNHFVTDDFFVSVKDSFSAHEYAFSVPIFNANVFGEFQKKNEWIKKYKINFEASENNLKLVMDSFLASVIRRSLEKMLQANFIEKMLGQWQKKRIEKNPKSKQIGGVIICNDSELAFWPNFENQGPKVFEKFQNRLVDLK